MLRVNVRKIKLCLYKFTIIEALAIRVTVKDQMPKTLAKKQRYKERKMIYKIMKQNKENKS